MAMLGLLGSSRSDSASPVPIIYCVSFVTEVWPKASPLRKNAVDLKVPPGEPVGRVKEDSHLTHGRAARLGTATDRMCECNHHRLLAQSCFEKMCLASSVTSPIPEPKLEWQALACPVGFEPL